MKKLMLLLMVFLSINAAAIVPNEVILNQANSAGTSYPIRFLRVPTVNALMYYDIGTNLPNFIDLGNLTISGGVINANLVNPDWNAITGYGEILNKPSSFTPAAHNQAWSTITATPTTLSGYGIVDADALGAATTAQAFSIQRANHTGTQTADTITDGTTNKAYTATEKTKLSGIATAATANDTDANLKNRANHTGTQSYTTITGLGTAANLNVPSSGNAAAGEVVKGNDTRLSVVYSGTTDASGNYTVTYASAYSAKPRVVFAIEGGTNKDTSVLSSTTTNGFTVKVERRSDALGLLPTYANVVGAVVNVSVTSQ